jgi:hypothetical protein
MPNSSLPGTALWLVEPSAFVRVLDDLGKVEDRGPKQADKSMNIRKLRITMPAR